MRDVVLAERSGAVCTTAVETEPWKWRPAPPSQTLWLENHDFALYLTSPLSLIVAVLVNDSGRVRRGICCGENFRGGGILDLT